MGLFFGSYTAGEHQFVNFLDTSVIVIPYIDPMERTLLVGKQTERSKTINYGKARYLSGFPLGF